MTFGRWLREELTKRKWTVEKAAAMIRENNGGVGPSVGTLYRLQEGRHEPSPMNREVIERTLKPRRKVEPDE